MNTIYSHHTIFELTKQFPELVDILASIGFKEITKPGMIASVGRFMTIKQGCLLRKINIEQVKEKLLEKGFILKEETNE
jgi:hypothetical protein